MEEPSDESVEHIMQMAHAHSASAAALYVLIRSLERGDQSLPLEPSAWDDTMAAFEWALGERMQGRFKDRIQVTPDDLVRARRLRTLVAEALSGGGPSPEMSPLAEGFLERFYGREWRESEPFRELGILELRYPIPDPPTGTDTGSHTAD